MRSLHLMHRSVTRVTQAQLARIVPRIVCGRVNLYKAFKKLPFGFRLSVPSALDIFTAKLPVCSLCLLCCGECNETRTGAEMRDETGRIVLNPSHERGRCASRVATSDKAGSKCLEPRIAFCRMWEDSESAWLAESNSGVLVVKLVKAGSGFPKKNEPMTN